MDSMVERVSAAIVRSGCPGREGPFGGYDYGYPDDTPVKGGRYVIRDFREIGSPDFGKWLHQTDDATVHEEMFAKMTREHIARAAIEAMMDPTPAMIDRFVSRALCVSVHGDGGWSNYAREQWQTMVQAALSDTEGR